jgi:hypothetical protein
MKRALELVEPLPAKIEDCSEQFDKVFDSLATELDWEERAPGAVRVESVEKVERLETTEPVEAPAPTPQISLVQSTPAVPSVPFAAPPAPESAADVLEQYERAFSVLDDKLAESDGGEVSNKLAERPKRRVVSDRHAALAPVQPAQPTLVKPKRPRRANRTFDDVFGVLENLTLVRRRGRLSEERHYLGELLAETRRLCADLDLQSARVRVEFAVLTLENDHFDKLGSEIDELARHIRHDLRFCSIAPGKKGR